MKADKRPILLVFGTSADPIHTGHVRVVTGAVRALQARGKQVAEVMLMPVFRHHNLQDAAKRSLPLTFEHRYDLSQLAADEIMRELGQQGLKISVSRLEETLAQSSNRPNFTSETLASLRQLIDPALKIAFLIGVDSFSGDEPSFGKWFQWQSLLETTMLVISPRQGFEPNFRYLQSLADQGADLVYLEEAPISPELLPLDETGEISQKTEEVLGPYELHDFFLFYAFGRQMSPDEVFRIAVECFQGDYTPAQILSTLKTFYRRFFSQQFKRSASPDGSQLLEISLSPRAGWHMPSDASSALWLEAVEKIQIPGNQA